MNRPFEPLRILISLKMLIPYLGVTFGVVFGTVFLSVLISALLVYQKLGKNHFAKKIADFYIYILRCTPSIVLLFIVFYGFPKLVKICFGANINFWPKIIFVLLSLSLLYSAQLAEIFRSAIEAVSKTQYVSALSLGMTKTQSYIYVIIPQAFVYALPNLGNSLIALLKEGSLAYTIGLIDVMGQGNLIISRNYGAYALETYIALAIIYWTLTFIIENLFKVFEKRNSKGSAYVS